MRFTDEHRRILGGLFVSAMLAGCAAQRAPAPATAPGSPAVRPAPAAPGPSAAARARNWDEYKLQAAQRLAAANPQVTYGDKPPQQLLAIPVLEIELNGDGSVRRVSVQRQPSQAPETVQIAIDAVRRAAPFGEVSHLPQPWRYSEVFLFREDRRFKPMQLDR